MIPFIFWFPQVLWLAHVVTYISQFNFFNEILSYQFLDARLVAKQFSTIIVENNLQGYET